ncbi:MAG: SDR family NAD(P)-dependent oxidoreductase [Caldilineales bacterium]|nr:SDR family NAD(P)-dependent oxidoreductase [Caldilineales bacterium]MDW8316668.1 SDR family NAD(P)-dependent oxidoreductase [Anaerolineae bacterium]
MNRVSSTPPDWASLPRSTPGIAAPEAGPVYEFYRGRRVLVTGGLGFIGSNLARRLVELGADVVVVDSLAPDCGGNPFNLADMRDRLQVHIADVRDREAMDALVAGCQVVFNLAGQVSHLDSMVDPFNDLELNARGPLSLLEACRRHSPDAKVVYAGTRQCYGRPLYLPLDEAHPNRPTDVNGVNKLAGELFHLVYGTAYGLRTCSLRLTNTYGPRQLMRHSRQGFIAWFVRLAMEGRTIQVYGDGRQRRDLTYVDDVVDAFLRAGASDAADGRVFNLGGSEPIALVDLARLIVAIAGRGQVELVPWPENRRRIDVGDVYSSYAAIQQALGWQPTTPLAEGLARMIAYYRQHWQHYVP